MSSTVTRDGVESAFEERRSGWGWCVVLGALVLVAGLVALGNLLLATTVSVLFVGAMMVVSGIVQIGFAFPVRGEWGRLLLWLTLGALYIAAGVIAFVNPVLATAVLTLFLAASLIVAGIVRMVAGFGMRAVKGWGWLLTSGILTLIVGFIVGAGWPANSLWVLGLFLGIDLVFAGVAYIVFGFHARTPGSAMTANAGGR